MILNGYIHDKLVAAHQRDLVEAAEHARLAAQARPSRRRRENFSLRSRAEGPRRRPVHRLAPHALKPRTVTR